MGARRILRRRRNELEYPHLPADTATSEEAEQAAGTAHGLIAAAGRLLPKLAFFSQNQELGDRRRNYGMESCMLPAFADSLATGSRPARGDATGIALLGTLFSNNVKDEVLARVDAVPGLSRSGPQIATAVQSGEIGNVIARLPEHARLAVGMITRAAFTTGLNRILLVAAVIALVSGVVSLAAIRGRDFAQQQRSGSPG